MLKCTLTLFSSRNVHGVDQDQNKWFWLYWEVDFACCINKKIVIYVSYSTDAIMLVLKLTILYA